jgi:hypothetical protein
VTSSGVSDRIPDLGCFCFAEGRKSYDGSGMNVNEVTCTSGTYSSPTNTESAVTKMLPAQQRFNKFEGVLDLSGEIVASNIKWSNYQMRRYEHKQNRTREGRLGK